MIENTIVDIKSEIFSTICEELKNKFSIPDISEIKEHTNERERPVVITDELTEE